MLRGGKRRENRKAKGSVCACVDEKGKTRGGVYMLKEERVMVKK